MGSGYPGGLYFAQYTAGGGAAFEAFFGPVIRTMLERASNQRYVSLASNVLGLARQSVKNWMELGD